MPSNHVKRRAWLRYGLTIWMAHAAAYAAEHHGRVFFNGAPVPGATVTAMHDGQQLRTVTDSQGIFQFPSLAEGEWTLRIALQGFELQDKAIRLEKTTPSSSFELKMLPAADILALAKEKAVFQTIPLPAAPMPKERKPETAELPPAPAPAADAEKGADGMLINGTENNAATSKYSISQAFGSRRPGAKGLYTGSIGGQLSTSPLDARPYSLTGLDVPKASYNRINGVITFGGPLKIPVLLRNGPTFFVGYQWTRNRTASTQSGLVPTEAQRNGDLSNTLTSEGTPVTIVDPATGLPITGPLQVSPQATALLKLFPLPNLQGSTRYNYQTQVLTNTHADALQSKLDKSIGRRDQIYGGFGFRSVRSDSENLFHFVDATDTLGIDSNVHWSHQFPHQLLIDTGYRFTRLRSQVRPYFANRENISGEADITGSEQSPQNWGPPDLAFSSLSGMTEAQSAFNRNRTDALSVEATWLHRRHTVSFGGDVRWQQYNQLSQENARGAFTFTGAATQGTASTGSDLADFLLGVPDASRIAYGNADKYFRQRVYDLFLNDDWRVRPELTLSTGIRWDYAAPMTELKGRLVNLDIEDGFTAVAPVLGSNPVGSLTGTVYPSSLMQPDRRKFEPRVGLAWRPLPTTPLVLRAGYGIYVDTSAYLSSVQTMSQQAPLSTSLNVSRGSDCALTLADGFHSCSGTTSNTFAIDPNFRVGYAQVWRLSIQQDLPGSTVVTASYLGTKGTRGPQEFLPNTYAPGATSFCTTCPRGFTYRTSNGNSIRHALDIQLRRRLRGGFTATLNYEYAKSIDNDSMLGGAGYSSSSTSSSSSSSSTTSASGGSGTSAASSSTSGTDAIAQNWLNLRAERSRSSFDQRHLVKFSFQYTTGMGAHSGNFFMGRRGSLLKQWTIASQLTAGTGLPQTPVYLATVPDTGVTGTIRPSMTGANIYAGTSGYYLNSAAFAAPAAGQWGNAGRYSVEGPGSLTIDSSIARNFRLRNPLMLDVRIDAMNVLNHVVYTGWNMVTNGTTFGLPANTQAMRSLQISGRLRF